MTSAGVAVDHLSAAVDAFRLKDLTFSLSPAETLVILGPNGSGKSVTLETVAGFHRAVAGRVVVCGRDVTWLPPEKRRIGFMVQDYGLFPHLTVAQNVALATRRAAGTALRNAARDADFPPDDIGALLDRFGIRRLAERRPDELSPGEKQRAAFARSLASRPALFLFDEPFSALDAVTRDALRIELKGFLRSVAVPAIFVTHDHTDASMLADRVLVLRGGEIVQSGAVEDIYRRPANAFVASFVGVENILCGRLTDVTDGLAAIALGRTTIRAAAPANAANLRREVSVCVRADDVSLHRPDRRSAPAPHINVLPGRIVSTRTSGALCTVQVDCGVPFRSYVLAREARSMALVDGMPVELEIRADAIHLMPAAAANGCGGAPGTARKSILPPRDAMRDTFLTSDMSGQGET